MVSVIAVLTGRIQQIKFMPRKSGNPNGRPFTKNTRMTSTRLVRLPSGRLWMMLSLGLLSCAWSSFYQRLGKTVAISK
jgi:hypothetical protein